MKYYQMDTAKAPIHFMRSTAVEVWWNDNFKTMLSPAGDWNNLMHRFQDFYLLLFSVFFVLFVLLDYGTINLT